MNKNIAGRVFGKKVYTDQYGYRVPITNYKYPLLKKSILILGDSVSFGVGVDEEYSFIGLIRSKKNINIFNSSVPGYNLENYLSILKLADNKVNFDKFVIFVCLNDIITSSGVLTKKDFYKKNYLLSKINVFLRNKSFTYIYLKSIITDPQKRYFDYLKNYYETNDFIMKLDSTFSQIKEYSLKTGKPFKVYILPYEYQTRKNNCNNSNLFPQTILAENLHKNNIEYLDLSNEFCNQDYNKKLFLKFDPNHFSLSGHKLIYDILDKQLIFN